MLQAPHPPSRRALTSRLQHDDVARLTDNGRGEDDQTAAQQGQNGLLHGETGERQRRRHVKTISCITSDDIHVLLIRAVSRALSATRLRTGIPGYGM